MSNKSINVGNITGTGIAVGDNNYINVKITQEKSSEIVDLLDQLRIEIQNASIPEGAKKVILNKAVPEMEKAMKSDNPESGLKQGLERINDQLEGAGAVASNVAGIVETVTKIAKTAGFAIKNVMPFIAAML